MKALPKRFVPLLVFGLPSLVACSMREQPAAGASGAEIYRASACATCHGEDLAGTGAAPSLLSLAENWQRGPLAGFVGDPESLRSGNARLVKLGLKFSAEMPAYANLSADELDRLAGFLLDR